MSEERRRGAQAPAEQQNQNQNRGGGGRGGRGPMGPMIIEKPKDLIGKTCVAILNLPPRKMMGIPSCGMLISAVHKEHGEEKLHLLMVDDSIPAGAKLC